LVVVAGRIVALSVSLCVALRLIEVLSSEIEFANVCSTVTLQVAERLVPSVVVAVIFATPTAIAVTTPLASTVAIASLSDFQVTALLVVVVGRMVVVNVAVSVALRVTAVVLSVIEAAGVGTTVTLQVAERLEPSAVVTVIVVSPTAIAVTTPFASTVATASFCDFQVTALLVVVAGSMLTESSAVSVALRLTAV